MRRRSVQIDRRCTDITLRAIYYVGLFGTLAAATVAYMYKPDSRYVSFAYLTTQADMSLLTSFLSLTTSSTHTLRVFPCLTKCVYFLPIAVFKVGLWKKLRNVWKREGNYPSMNRRNRMLFDLIRGIRRAGRSGVGVRSWGSVGMGLGLGDVGICSRRSLDWPGEDAVLHLISLMGCLCLLQLSSYMSVGAELSW